MNTLRAIEPERLNKIEGEWEEIELAVDSGATETAIGEVMVAAVETKEGEASRRGVMYEVADGTMIPNQGEKRFKAESEEGVQRTLTAQVAGVNKALLSVSKVVKASNRVVFDGEGCYIEDKKTGDKMWLRESGGMFMLKMWANNSDSGF